MSRLTTELALFHVYAPESKERYRLATQCGLYPSKCLREVALSLAVSPIRFQYLNPKGSFGAVAPILYASFTLESIAAIPYVDVIKMTDSDCWNASGNSLDLEALRFATSELIQRPDQADQHQRDAFSRKYHRISHSTFLVLSSYIAIFKPQGLGIIFYNYWTYCWLEKKVFIRRSKQWLFLEPLSTFTKEYLGDGESLPGVVAGLIAYPKIYALILARELQQLCHRIACYLWPLLFYQHQRLRFALMNVSNVPLGIYRDNLVYLPPALCLYFLRGRYFSTFGAHAACGGIHGDTPWSQIKYAAVNPEGWIKSTGSWTWWGLIKYYVAYTISTLPAFTSTFAERHLIIRHTARIYSVFWLLLILDRTMCMITHCFLTISTPIAVLIQPPAPLISTSPKLSLWIDVIRPALQISVISMIVVCIRFAIVILNLRLSF